MTTRRLERALADLFGGFDGGLTLWELALGRLSTSADAARSELPFKSYPAGALNRLLVDVQDALRVAELAVELQAVLAGDADGRDDDHRRDQIADLLLERARKLSDTRLGGAPPNSP